MCRRLAYQSTARTKPRVQINQKRMIKMYKIKLMRQKFSKVKKLLLRACRTKKAMVLSLKKRIKLRMMFRSLLKFQSLNPSARQVLNNL